MLTDPRSTPWAILPETLTTLVMQYDARQKGSSPPLTQAERDTLANRCQAVQQERAAMIRASVRKVAGVPVQYVGKVAVLPMYGVIQQRPDQWSAYGLATSTEQFVQAHRALLADETVRSVVWDIDSPGGSVAGVPEAASQLFAMRGQKRTVAFSNTMMASAAYWLGVNADEVVATPSSITGSIGVVAVHADFSQANDKAGVGISYIHAGKYKVEGNPDNPLSAEARGAIQQTIDDYYAQFTRAVSVARNTSRSAVQKGYGEGRALTAARARAANLVDRVETLDAVLGRLGAFDGRPGGANASYLLRQRQAEAELI